jgi:hypothetical protein
VAETVVHVARSVSQELKSHVKMHLLLKRAVSSLRLMIC